MAKFTEAQLEQEFKNCANNGALDGFKASAAAHGWSVELLLGIGSRETNLQNIRGDFHGGTYHGFGIMQVDIGTDRGFCNSGAWKDVKAAIERGTQILDGKRTYLANHGVQEPALTRASVSAYNTGEGNAWRSIKLERNTDHTTTGGDYAADVMARAEVFKRLLEAEV
jgi:hypothetical protein